MRNLKRLMVAVATVGLLAVCVSPVAGAAANPPSEGGSSFAGLELIKAKLPRATGAGIQEEAFIIRNRHSLRCLDADLGTINRNGTIVQLWDCIEGADNQAWFIRQNEEGFTRFQNVRSGRYLDADLGSISRDGTTVQLWDFVAGGKNQWWFADVTNEGFIRIINGLSTRHLDADLGTVRRNGTRVQLWGFIAGAKNQWWGG